MEKPRTSVNPAAKSTFEELLYFIHTSNMSIHFNHQQTQITKLSGTKMSQNLQTPKPSNTKTSKFSASQLMNIPLNPRPGFGYPKNPHRKHGKNSSISPNSSATHDHYIQPRLTPGTFGHEAPTR